MEEILCDVIDELCDADMWIDPKKAINLDNEETWTWERTSSLFTLHLNHDGLYYMIEWENGDGEEGYLDSDSEFLDLWAEFWGE
jgi:hypothetical protein